MAEARAAEAAATDVVSEKELLTDVTIPATIDMLFNTSRYFVDLIRARSREPGPILAN